MIKTPQITTSEAIKLIQEARNAELCRDISGYRQILERVWASLDDEPELEGLDILLQAEIYRRCGFFLSYYGHSRNLKNYQERGRNFLTRAIDIFTRESLPEKAAEANIILALCYWYEGARAESEFIWSEIEREYSDNPLHPIFIQVRVNRMLGLYQQGEYTNALEIIEQLSIPIELCKDIRLKTLFHNQAGIVYQLLKQTENAIFHTIEAIKTAKQVGNLRYAAGSLNNLGNTYKNIGKYDLAHQCIDQAYKTYAELEEAGWAANVLDTKAQVYLAESNLEKAMPCADEAVKVLKQGEDYAGLVESLFTKCQILVRLDRLEEIFPLSSEIFEITKQRIGEKAAKQYANNFAELIGLKRSDKNKVIPLDVIGCKIIYHEVYEKKLGFTFRISGLHLPSPKTAADLIILVQQIEKSSGQTAIVQNCANRHFICGVLYFDKLTNMYFLDVGDKQPPLILDDYKYFGSIIGYCPYEPNLKTLIFKPFI